MDKICGIYKITSPSGKIYIGQAIDINHRIIAYKGARCKGQQKLYNSIIKYGWNAHMFEIIHECNESELNDLERYYIKFYDSFNTEHGLNLNDGGSNNRPTEETKRKMSNAMKGNKIWEGRKHTEEYKLYMSKLLKNRTFSEKTIEKMRISAENRTASEKTRQKMSIAGIERWKKRKLILQ
jgi:group I intron endonuclease